MGLKILFTPSDNNLAGAFQSMVRLCVLLRDKHDCDVLVLLRRSGRGEEYSFEGNTIYEGEFFKGKRNGEGKVFNNEFNGNLKYEGIFLDGKLIKKINRQKKE